MSGKKKDTSPPPQPTQPSINTIPERSSGLQIRGGSQVVISKQIQYLELLINNKRNGDNKQLFKLIINAIMTKSLF